MKLPPPLKTLLSGLVPRLLFALLAFLTLTASAQNTGAGRTRTSGTGSAVYPGSTEIGGATVTYDQETRKLIVIADEETAAYVSQVVTNLDRPAPQVLIKVVFLEVTYRNGMDLGVEGAYQKDVGNGNVATLGQAFGGLPGINSGSGLYQLAGSEFQVTLRAIAEAGKLEVLSRPTILARNNQEATITVGQQVPLITNVRYDNFGNQINAITYQSVGIILRVTPFITSNGMVEMIVSPEISNLSDQTVAISTGTNSVGAPVINTRSADTVVITPDGQTVVIGGLMQNSKTSSTSKIPFLGDIPGLGALFRRKVTSDVKTELLIFLTPQIVKHPTLLTSVTAKEQANQQITPQAFSQEDLNRFLRDLPPKAPEPQKKKRRSRSTESQ
ncbi:MAG: type II secretion system protein GspD [Verrucomicrobiales bacterium]|nr:type II secretion system protein GspD [Verrucomicrobiales bacterium]